MCYIKDCKVCKKLIHSSQFCECEKEKYNSTCIECRKFCQSCKVQIPRNLWIKKCNKCKISKDFSEYYKNKKHPDGHVDICRVCILLKAKEKRDLIKIKK